MFVCFFFPPNDAQTVGLVAVGTVACEDTNRCCVVFLGLPVLKGYVAARRGEREEMQDAHVLQPDMSSCLPPLPQQV